MHKGGHRDGRQGAGAFFSVIARPEVLARKCHHQVNPASEKVVTNEMSRRIKPGRARVHPEGGASAHVTYGSIASV